jgi:hypothetical protein
LRKSTEISGLLPPIEAGAATRFSPSVTDL